ncbi:hypothetical protein H2199_006195 [Coniosporium tulheliwenetii]|uniref:Uncharacterized protein n=1 Tax=Coniosporium tulheliwenetii TaxID=3383036 RepID=A0ACC2YXA0_9PEZI|nr:hypothetical protein H2199_006195 [Cladosporium sp. JES 115]
MDRDSQNLWIRRSNSSKLSLSTPHTDRNDSKNDHPPRTFSSSKRFGGADSSHGKTNPFNAISPLTTNNTSSPISGGSTAFGLGTGAFASFGTKTPKTPGTAFDFGKSAGAASPSTPSEKRDKKSSGGSGAPARTTAQATLEETTTSSASSAGPDAPWPLKYTWIIYYRPPTSKNSDYEQSIQPKCKMATAQDFWKVYAHLTRPSSLPTVSDYHFFKEGIRPVWEDEENKKGGKWILRLKKGVADRYWENLVLAMIGDQFAEAGEEVCGAVVSVRSGEDVISIWTKNNGGRNVKIRYVWLEANTSPFADQYTRETIKRELSLPPDTIIVWKSHDDSIAQRTAFDQARQEKTTHHGSDKRRSTLNADDSNPAREKSNAT